MAMSPNQAFELFSSPMSYPSSYYKYRARILYMFYYYNS